MQLGFCKPPEPIYLYVGAEQDCLWYQFDIEADKKIPVQERGLAGYISELRLIQKEFKGKESIKLDIVVSANDVYVVRTGIETNFAKTFLLAVNQVKDFSRPLILAVAPGQENVVFCRVYDAATKQRYKAEWNSNADWAAIIASVQSRLTQPSTPSLQLVQPRSSQLTDRSTLINQSTQLLQELGWTNEEGSRYLQRKYGVRSRQHLSDEQLIDFVGHLQKVNSLEAGDFEPMPFEG